MHQGTEHHLSAGNVEELAQKLAGILVTVSALLRMPSFDSWYQNSVGKDLGECSVCDGKGRIPPKRKTKNARDGVVTKRTRMPTSWKSNGGKCPVGSQPAGKRGRADLSPRLVSSFSLLLVLFVNTIEAAIVF